MAAAAGYSFLYLFAGGGFGVAPLIFIVAKMMGKSDMPTGGSQWPLIFFLLRNPALADMPTGGSQWPLIFIVAKMMGK